MRPKHNSIPESRYFITCRCAPNRIPFAVRNNCAEYCAILAEKMERLDFKIIAYVLMPDHVHLLLETGKYDTLQKIIQHVSGSAAFRINGLEGTRGTKLWQGGFFDSRSRTVTDLIHRINYIHCNPVRSGLVNEPSRFAYSSAGMYRYILGSDTLNENVLRGKNIESILSTMIERIAVALKGDLPR